MKTCMIDGELIPAGILCFRFVSNKDTTGYDIMTRDFTENERHILVDSPQRLIDLMTGMDFFHMVEDKSIMNYDGFINKIYVDGYISNLGLWYENFYDGNFLVDENTWKEICRDHEVYVNWANK